MGKCVCVCVCVGGGGGRVKVVTSACTLAMCIYTGNVYLHVEICCWLYTASFTNLSVNYAILLVCLTCVIPTLKHDLTC